MATFYRLFSRRLRSAHSLLPHFSTRCNASVYYLLPPQPPIIRPPSLTPLLCHSFSTRSNDDSESYFNSATESELVDVTAFSEVAKGVANGGGGGSSGETSILPVDTMISLLDAYHDLTGLPWWIVIASSTVAMRTMLLPLFVLQLNKMRRISELFPKLPPPFPPPLSGKSYIEQIKLFQTERRKIGCPSYLWFLAYFSVQVPCFLLWMTSIRRMSLDHHPGFDCGGTLWFWNLTELPHGGLGFIIPSLIAGLHYINIQLSFEKSAVREMTGLLGWIAKLYKQYLDFLTVPLFFIGYYLPQGSLVYWVTNSSLSTIQHLLLKHPAIRAKLGLPDKGSPTAAADPVPVEIVAPETGDTMVPAENLSPEELFAFSVQLLSSGQEEVAISLLRLAIEKDPDYVRALALMGQTLMRKEKYAEATEYLDQAISKLLLAGPPTEAENIDILILASQWAGTACIWQGKKTEGLAHLERIASLEEPDDPKSKNHYFEGIVLLASALHDEGHRDEAVKYLRLAVVHNPVYNKLLERCEKDGDNLVVDLVNSRRRDY